MYVIYVLLFSLQTQGGWRLPELGASRVVYEGGRPLDMDDLSPRSERLERGCARAREGYLRLQHGRAEGALRDRATREQFAALLRDRKRGPEKCAWRKEKIRGEHEKPRGPVVIFIPPK